MLQQKHNWILMRSISIAKELQRKCA
ncbi:hypothetical protein Pint_07445 [Pistacia integerrima]|uniref:Uncharacterized protein n=2 Tax=Pistacia TaxID=55512 RepID=A0ACC1ADZ3_9ROSI|nr:hypothetical protein Pint_07445 [Pistacia integerrima]KAJ0085247.1 hypothetical protein Patl1_07550 [Pistacia atlantica]